MQTNSKSIDDLRGALFMVIEGLLDKSAPLEVDRAKAICGACEVLVNTAKVEVDFLRLAGGRTSEFLQQPPAASKPASPGSATATGRITQHLLGG